MYVWAGRSAFAWPYVGVHRSTSLMSSSLLIQQCPACLVRLAWIFFVMGGRWPSTLEGNSLKLVDKFTYLGSSVSSTEKDIETRLTKAWTAIDRLSIIWKSDLTDKMKRSFFQAAVVSILLYGCTTWMLTKRLEKKLDGNIIHLQMQNTGGNRQTLLFKYERFIKFWLQFFDTRRDIILIMLTISKARHILWCLRSLSVEIRKTQLHALTVENSTLRLTGPISTLNWLSFKILKFPGPSLPGMTSSKLQLHLLSGVYYDNGDCHILYARA